MKMIVTGGAGFIGSHCAEYFAGKGWDVVVVDNLMRSKIFGSEKKSVEYNWHYLESVKRVTLVKEDIRDFEAMQRLFQQVMPDAVIHTAAQPGVRFSLDDPREDYSINATGSLNVLEALRQANPKAKLVYCSTNKVFGDNVNAIELVEKEFRYEFKDHSGVDERFSIDLTGHTPYGVSKLVGDLYAQDYAYVHGMDCAVFRMSCIYGTRQFGFEDQGWLAWFSLRYLAGEPVTIYGDGKQIRDVLWVEDLVRAYEAFIENGRGSEVINMGGGVDNTLSLLELTHHLNDITGRTVEIRYDDWRKFDQKVYVTDITKAKKVLDWQPTVNPRKGVERLVAWIKDNPRIFQ